MEYLPAGLLLPQEMVELCKDGVPVCLIPITLVKGF
jgi:hypothetical protein